MAIVHTRVRYSNNMTLTVKDKSFRQVVELVFTNPAFADKKPLWIEFITTNKILYASRSHFMAYIKYEIETDELLAITECDALYRNKVDIKQAMQTIEKGSLWMRRQQNMILIDNDNPAEETYHETMFAIVD